MTAIAIGFIYAWQMHYPALVFRAVMQAIEIKTDHSSPANIKQLLNEVE